MRRFAGSCRFVYNQALALQKARYEHGEKRLGYAGLCGLLTEWKNHPGSQWLTESPSQALQQSLKDRERAYQNFWRHAQSFLVSKRRAHGIASVSRKDFNSIRFIAVSSCPSSAGYAIGIAGRLWARLRMSPSVTSPAAGS